MPSPTRRTSSRKRSAATRIQKRVRGKQTRKQVTKLKATRRIQSRVRGNTTRKLITRIRSNMLVDNETTLNNIFSKVDMLIATHCEDEKTIQANLQKYTNEFGDNIKPEHHPLIRSAEACYKSSSKELRADSATYPLFLTKSSA